MPSAARTGDQCVPHCSPFVIGLGSLDVAIDNRPAARVGDSVTPHLFKVGKKCLPHAPSIITGSATVFINNRPAARVGDSILQCTRIASGSFDVFIGV